MERRHFLASAIATSAVGMIEDRSIAERGPSDARHSPSAETVLFAFDDSWLPFQHGVQLKLVSYSSSETAEESNMVVPLGPPGAPDSRGIIYYGTVCEVAGELWMWYLGLGDHDQERHFRICMAKSKDGRNWEKPNLGLVEYAGSRRNNLIDLDNGSFSVAGCVVYYDPEDPDPGRRFKMVFTGKYKGLLFAVAYSRDGVRWTESPQNPRGAIKLEPQGGIRWQGAYYLNGQGGLHWAPQGWTRMLVTHMSYDFENWTEATALGFRRDSIPPRPVDLTGGIDGEQVHLGAALWNRGNVVLGFYGQWHGSRNNDRRWVSIDTGLVISHDVLHFREPIPDFRLVEARETPTWWLPYGEIAPLLRAPALMQGQGFANIGDETLFWYSIWVVPSAGVRLARWERDRLGYLQPFVGPDKTPHIISAPIATGGKPVSISLNVAGLNDLSKVKVSVLDEKFLPLPGYTALDCSGPLQPGLRQPVQWGARERVANSGPIRIRVDFAGVRPEEVKLYAVYANPTG
jgi:hypothetical protein